MVGLPFFLALGQTPLEEWMECYWPAKTDADTLFNSVASLYGGLTAHMFRVVPNAACMFLIYEVVAERLGS